MASYPAKSAALQPLTCMTCLVSDAILIKKKNRETVSIKSDLLNCGGSRKAAEEAGKEVQRKQSERSLFSEKRAQL